ncbi:hypothetical protein JCM10207_007136 [Rhodosporidiobolus poonsookiae]
MHALSTLATLALLPLAALAAPTPVEQPQAVRLAGRAPSSTVNNEVLARSIARLVQARDAASVSPAPAENEKAKRAQIVPLDNWQYGDFLISHSGNVKMGAALKEIPVLFDTGSADLIVPTTCIDDCPSGFYDTRRSRTFVDTKVPEAASFVGGGGFTGTLARDNVRLGSLTVIGQSFLAATNAVLPSEFNWAGIMGLSPWNTTVLRDAADKPVVNFLTNVVKNGNQLLNRQFSLYFSRERDVDSELVLGGADANHYTGELTTLPQVKSLDQRYWAVQSAANYVNGAEVDVPKTAVIFDSGTSQNLVPRALAASIYESMGAVKVATSVLPVLGEAHELDQYTVPCDAAAPAVGFKFAGSDRVFEMQAADAIMYQTGDNECLGSFFGVDVDIPDGSEQGALLGLPFHKSFYSAYQFNADGSAAAVALAISK